MQYLYIYLAAVSLIGFFMMAADKRKAIKSKPRVSEKTLFITAWIGGSLGVYLGIFAFRHKTKHKNFTVGLPFIMAAQIAAVLLISGLKFT
jgi:uncharacterized membrane protein YsdA (DUF1294 family)